jgi:hypothetical protein
MGYQKARRSVNVMVRTMVSL